jgi:hypothetical protein
MDEFEAYSDTILLKGSTLSVLGVNIFTISPSRVYTPDPIEINQEVKKNTIY